MGSLMDSAPCDGNFVDEQAAEPLDPWADAARATLPRGGVDHAEVHGEDGGSTRRAWRKGKHSDENAVGNPSGTVGEHGAEQDSYEPDDDEQYDASKHAWTEAGPWPQYDPTKHEWTPALARSDGMGNLLEHWLGNWLGLRFPSTILVWRYGKLVERRLGV